MRKLARTLPSSLPDRMREEALGQVSNDRTRARLRARIMRQGAR
ncbi:MAG: hypothetical protein V4510_09735 [bacterium]